MHSGSKFQRNKGIGSSYLRKDLWPKKRLNVKDEKLQQICSSELTGKMDYIRTASWKKP